ncbi:MAG: zinc-ribbon domain-containing protein [Mariniphaga sp.]|nr:zinc-ribbon domain-containing protein [Mariniphaga sp.]
MKNNYSISAMKNIALSRKGKCLSLKYEGQKAKLLWQCEFGHKWEASPNSIIHLKSWCPECAGNKKYDLAQVQHIAQVRGGKCLSKDYTNSKVKLLWECGKGHKWYATTFSIKTRNSWCPECKSYLNH